MEVFRPYFRLVRFNHNYRRLWLSQIVANFGDWFGILAVYALVLHYTDSELLLGLIIVVKMLSFAVFSPIAGYLTDRFDRRTLMLLCDIGRGVVVLGFLLVNSESMLWFAFFITSLQMMMAAVFEPAKSSSIPNITSEDELVYANVLSNLSWSVIFTAGMAIGGLATAWLGTSVVFVINAFTYILSAYFIYFAVIPHIRDEAHLEKLAKPFKGIIDGLKYLKSRGDVLRPALAKGFYEISLGGMVFLLILISENVLLTGSVGLGILYGARGIGTAVGPLTIKGWFGDESKWIMLIGFCMIITGIMYFFVGLTASLIAMIPLVLVAHAASGANWVMSTVLIQKRSPDEFRGRIFSSEWLFFTVCESFSVLFAALILEFNLLEINTVILVMSVMLIASGIFWLLFVAQKEKKYQQHLNFTT